MNKVGAAWLRKNDACSEGRRWALSECASLAEVWRDARPDWLVWVATRPDVLDDRTLWLFACWAAEQVLPIWYASYPDDHRPRVAIETRRRWIDGQATDAELAAAMAAADAARAAADAAWAAALAAAGAGAAAAAWAAAWAADAARAAERAAARAAAAAAAWAAARAAAGAAAGDAQAQWLRANATPRFPDALAQLAATPAGIARACGLENEVEDAQAAVAPC